MRKCWPSWRHSLGDEIVDSWCPRATLGDSGSLAKLREAGPGLVPWEATVSTVHANSALHPGRGVCGRNFMSLAYVVLEYRGGAFLF